MECVIMVSLPFVHKNAKSLKSGSQNCYVSLHSGKKKVAAAAHTLFKAFLLRDSSLCCEWIWRCPTSCQKHLTCSPVQVRRVWCVICRTCSFNEMCGYNWPPASKGTNHSADCLSSYSHPGSQIWRCLKYVHESLCWCLPPRSRDYSRVQFLHHLRHLFSCFSAHVVAPLLSLDDTFCHPLLWAITTLIHPAPPSCPTSLTHTHLYIMVLVNTQRTTTTRVCLTALWQEAVVWHLAELFPHNYDLPRTHIGFPHLPHPARLYCPHSIKEAAGCISTGGTVWPGIYPIVPSICGCPEWMVAMQELFQLLF